MPRFSVIVPAHGVAGRLARALESVLGQSFDDVELIPVCAAPDSLDASIAARFARHDTRVRPVCSPPADGLAGARNTGLCAAVGDHLLFLDGDDTLTPGALVAVADRLRETGDVDVLLIGHERVHWWLGPQPDEAARELLDRAPADTFAPDDTPWLTGTELPAWSAVHRRRFVAERELSFPAGYFTDIGWGATELAAAVRVAVLRTVCVSHLLRRQGSMLKHSPEHQGDLLDQVDLVLTGAAERGLSGARLDALFERLTAETLRVLSAPDRLPADRRRAFFQRAAELHRRHRPAGFRPPPGTVGVQYRLLAAGAYGAFTALRGAHRGAGHAAARARARADGIRARRLQRGAYAAFLREPVDENLAVYCAYWGRGYACNPAAIHAAARRLAPHIRSVFLVDEDVVDQLPPGVDHAVTGSPRYWQVLARAKYLINNANFEGAVVKRPGTVHLQTQHGTPLKKMGIEQAPYPVVAAGTGSFGKLLSRIDRWDYNISSNRHSTEVWEREFPAAYETLQYGYPRNDVYVTATAADVAGIRARLGIPEDRTAILYAPTHRDYRSTFDAQLDLAAFCAEVGDAFVVLLRAHYFYGRDERAAVEDGRIIDVTAHPSAEEVCLAADALVTDYSSIMFDYADLDRPIVVYADDWDVYRETRGVTFDLLESPPGPVARDERELARVFRDGTWADARSAALRARFRERFCEFDDGFAAERVVRRVLLGEPEEALAPVIPLAQRTPAPAAHPGAPSGGGTSGGGPTAGGTTGTGTTGTGTTGTGTSGGGSDLPPTASAPGRC